MADRIAILRAGRIVQVGTPVGLYREPENAFVCEFLGETNFLPGTVRRIDGDAVTIETPVGPLQALQPLPDGVGAGSAVQLSIRPEALTSAGPGSTNTLSGKLLETTYLGESIQQVIEAAPGITLRSAIANPGLTLAAVGSTVNLTVSPADIVVLANETSPVMAGRVGH